MIISHDLGTTGDKATLVDATGAVVASVAVAYDTDFGPGGKAEQDPNAWWDALCAASRSLLERIPGAAARLEGVSFSGQMMGAVLLDDAGAVVRPALIWADTRSTEQAGALADRIGMEHFYALTGHRANATYSLSKVMWVRDNEPEAFGRTRHVVLAKDYVAFRLTGVLATDPSDASSTNAYDQSAGEWSDDILGAAGIDRVLLPEIVPSTTVIGRVTPEAARASGIPAGTSVVMGGGDGPMAALGAGIIAEDSGAYAYLGSSSWVSLATPAPLHDPQMRTMTFNHVIPGMYVPTATMQAGGASLQWIVDVLAPDEPERYERLLASSAGVLASADGLYFLPHLLGERSPYWNPHARGVFAGLARHHGQEHLVRAVIEGVAFNLLTGLRAFAENGARFEGIDAIGGAANSTHLLRILADVWGVTVRRRSLVDEATALGAAVVGGVGVGMFDDFDVATGLSERSAPIEPSEARHAGYRDEYAIFLEAYRRLEPWFELTS